MAAGSQPNIEILVHVAAPSTAKHDELYRKLAAGYLAFELASPILGSDGEPSQSLDAIDWNAEEQLHRELRDSQSQEEQQPSRISIYEDEDDSYRQTESQSKPSIKRSYLTRSHLKESTGSPSASFNSVLDNVDSPNFKSHSQITGSGSFVDVSQDKENDESWEPPPSEVGDSQSTRFSPIPELITPTRVLEVMLQNRSIDVTGSHGRAADGSPRMKAKGYDRMIASSQTESIASHVTASPRKSFSEGSTEIVEETTIFVRSSPPILAPQTLSFESGSSTSISTRLPYSSPSPTRRDIKIQIQANAGKIPKFSSKPIVGRSLEKFRNEHERDFSFESEILSPPAIPKRRLLTTPPLANKRHKIFAREEAISSSAPATSSTNPSFSSRLPPQQPEIQVAATPSVTAAPIIPTSDLSQALTSLIPATSSETLLQSTRASAVPLTKQAVDQRQRRNMFHILSSDYPSPSSLQIQILSSQPTTHVSSTPPVPSTVFVSSAAKISDTAIPRLTTGNITASEIHPPSPLTSTSTAPIRTITPFLHETLITQSLSPDATYKPLGQTRELERLERGYWLFDMTKLVQDIKGLSEAEQSTRLRSLRDTTWSTLVEWVGEGKAGWGVWVMKEMERNAAYDGEKREEDGEVVNGKWRIFCWGEAVKHIYLMMHAATDGKIIGAGAKWVDGGGDVVVIMP